MRRTSALRARPTASSTARTASSLPGFVNTHVHLSEHVNRGVMADEIPVDRYMGDWLIPLYSAITPEEEAYSARLACLEMIRTGTTTFCEAGTLFDVAAVADAVDAIGMRAVLGRWTWDMGGHEGRLAQTTDEALRHNDAMIRSLKGRADGRISAWPLLLGFGTCSEDLIRGAHALAEKHGTGWGMMHLASHPSRKTADTMPLDALDAMGVLGPRTKLTHMVYVGNRRHRAARPARREGRALPDGRRSSTPRGSGSTAASRRCCVTASPCRSAATAATDRTTSTCCG